MQIGGFDIVLRMDWLMTNKANINCAQKTLDVRLPNGSRIEIKGDKTRKTNSLISMMKAEKCLRKGHESFLLYVIIENEEKKIKDVPVVAEFEDVFLEDLPGLPPPRQVKFRIDLQPGTTPTAKAPYQLASSEMQELMRKSKSYWRKD
jgi:hypothetical protein